jgi:hypothetical protein
MTLVFNTFLFFLFFFFFWWYLLEFELQASHLLDRRFYHLIHSDSPVCVGYFQGGVCQPICPGWLKQQSS